MAEITAGLMSVNKQNQMELWRHGDGAGLLEDSIQPAERSCNAPHEKECANRALASDAMEAGIG
jgi:hypothetical protein